MEGDAGDGKNKNVWHELIKGRCIIGSKQKSRRFHHCCDNSALITCHHFPLLPQLCTYHLPLFFSLKLVRQYWYRAEQQRIVSLTKQYCLHTTTTYSYSMRMQKLHIPILKKNPNYTAHTTIFAHSGTLPFVLMWQ